METSHVVFLICVALFTTIAAACDLRTKKLPNVLTVPAFVGALVFHVTRGALDAGWAGAGDQLRFSLAGFGTGFGLLLIMWLIGSGGGGDVKFMGALGAWLGSWMTLKVFIVAAVFVVLGGLAVLAWEFVRLGFGKAKTRYMDREPTGRGQKMSPEKHRERRRLLPLGVPAALATWLLLVLAEMVGKLPY